MGALNSVRGQDNLPRYFAQVFARFSRISKGQISIQLPDGRVFLAKGATAGPKGHWDVTNPDMFARILREGNLGFAEGYLEAWWDTPDLQGFLDVLLANHEVVSYQIPGSSLVRLYERIRHKLKANSRSQAPKNIAQHYEFGADFFGSWLDETMSYSSALYNTDAEELATAQRQKLAAICDAIAVKPGDHILDIGCGWGGFALYAAQERGAKVTGLTISQGHFDYCNRLVADAGLEDHIKIEMRDYRDETGVYDGISSIEMIEHVGEKYWPAYFSAIRDRLKPGGIATVQAITMDDALFADYRRSVDFMRKHIFPGGMLPSPAIMQQQITAAGMAHVNTLAMPDSYSKTLRLWDKAFCENWPDISALGFDARFKRMWRYYLCMSAAGMNYGATSVGQFSMQNPGP